MQRTKIDWADYVWNPVTGCTKVSAGCQNCYAEAIAKRFWGQRKFTDVQYFPEKLEEPLRIDDTGIVFVNSMSDIFHPNVPENFILDIREVMRQASWYTFVILTKRADRMQRFFSTFRFSSNVWPGVSVEDQPTADERIPLLLQTPAAKRIVSVEPMLELVNLRRYLPLISKVYNVSNIGFLDWVICGKETGPRARPFDGEWAFDLLKQCHDSQTPFWWKGNPEWQERPELDVSKTGMQNAQDCRVKPVVADFPRNDGQGTFDPPLRGRPRGKA